MNGGIIHIGGSMYNNIASSIIVSEITESGYTSIFWGVTIHDNKIITWAELKIEGWRCLNLCFIEQAYLTFLADNYDEMFSLYWIQTNIFKLDVTFLLVEDCIIYN